MQLVYIHQQRLGPSRALDLIGHRTCFSQHQPGAFVSATQLSTSNGWIDVPNPVTAFELKGATGLAITSLLPFGRLFQIGTGD